MTNFKAELREILEPYCGDYKPLGSDLDQAVEAILTLIEERIIKGDELMYTSTDDTLEDLENIETNARNALRQTQREELRR